MHATAKWKRSTRRRVLEMVAACVPKVDIARRLGISERRVHQIVAEARRAHEQRNHPQDAASGWPGAATLPAAAG